MIDFPSLKTPALKKQGFCLKGPGSASKKYQISNPAQTTMHVLKTSIRLIKFCILIILIGAVSTLQAQQSDTNSNRSPADPASVNSSVDSIVTVPDIKAMPVGGLNTFSRFVAENFHYPKRCQSKGINGYVLLRFVVNTDGNINNISVLKETAACPKFTKEAIRVMQTAPPWIPGQKNGRAVSTYYQLPIKLEVQN